jgi:HD superfamily phosphohydrolase
MSLASIPEIAALESGGEGVRLPPGDTAPLTPRVRALLDTADMRRLARVSQLGLVGLVYPGAVHSRLEHSLGVYRLAIEFLRRLKDDSRFATAVGPDDASAFIAAALVHDIGHWPFCHPIEDMGLAEIPRHESLVAGILASGPVADVLDSSWGIPPQRIASLITGAAADPAGRILHSLLSGPIDVDKMDYLARDSLHAGVPYGRNFDQPRLLASLCLDERGEALAITDKGRTAAELMVFARYVMFSEVYWHHAVRSATAMLQRSVFELRNRSELVESWLDMDDSSFKASVLTHSKGAPSESCASGIFGPSRMLYKRIAQFDRFCEPELHRTIASKPYAELLELSSRLADLLSNSTPSNVGMHDVLIDAPPVECEVQFDLRIRQKSGQYLELIEVSPVVQALATRQFDAMVKRVRVFVHPRLRDSLKKANIPGLLRGILDGSS